MSFLAPVSPPSTSSIKEWWAVISPYPLLSASLSLSCFSLATVWCPFSGVQSFRSKLLQRGSPTGCSSCHKSGAVWPPLHRLQLPSGHIDLLWLGTCSIAGSAQVAAPSGALHPLPPGGESPWNRCGGRREPLLPLCPRGWPGRSSPSSPQRSPPGTARPSSAEGAVHEAPARG